MISQVGHAVSGIIQEVNFGVMLEFQKFRQKCQKWLEFEPLFVISRVGHAASMASSRRCATTSYGNSYDL